MATFHQGLIQIYKVIFSYLIFKIEFFPPFLFKKEKKKISVHTSTLLRKSLLKAAVGNFGVNINNLLFSIWKKMS